MIRRIPIKKSKQMVMSEYFADKFKDGARVFKGTHFQ